MNDDEKQIWKGKIKNEKKQWTWKRLPKAKKKEKQIENCSPSLALPLQQFECIKYYCWTIASVLFIISFEIEFGKSLNWTALACKLANM